MSRADLLKDAILQAAMQGKLTEQLDTDSSVDELLKTLKLKKIETDEYAVPDNWAVLKISSICDIKNGFTPKRSVEDYWNKQEIPWFTVEDINSQGHIIYATQQYISKRALGKSNERMNPANTVLLCCTSATIGNYALTKIPLTTNQQWNGLVIKSEVTNYIMPEFIYLWARTLKEKLMAVGGTTTFPFVSVKKLYSFPVPLPPIEEQQRIVERVDELLAKVDEFEKIEIQLVNLKQNFPSDLRCAILQAAIQGKLTEQLDTDSSVDELIKEIDSCRKSMIKRGIYKPNNHLKEMTDSDIPFDIPDTWRWVRLGYCSTYGQTKEKATAEDCMSDIWSLDLEDIEKVTGNVVKKWRAEERQISGDKIKFYKGNILYSKLRPYLLKILIADDDGICSPELIPFDMIGDISNRYIMWVLRSPHIDFTINSVTYGVKMPRVSTDTMVNLLIPLPPIEEQRRIVEKLDKLIPLCDELNI